MGTNVKLFILLLLIASSAFSTKRYVSTTASGGDGTIGNPWTLAESWVNASAGDTVYLRAGTYTVGIEPNASGSAGSPIRWQNYESEYCSVYVASDNCIAIDNKDYIEVVGIKFQMGDYNGYVVNVTDADHVLIQDCRFYGGRYQNNASKGDWPSIRFNVVNHLRFIGNLLDRQDDDVLTTSDDYRGDGINLYGTGSNTRFNVIAACTVYNVSHYAISVPYGLEGADSYNIVSNCVTYNSHVGFGAIDQNQRCLFEGNRSYSPSQMLTYRWGYSFEGTSINGIFRYNMFYDDSIGYDNNETSLYTANAAMTQGANSLDSANRYYNNLFMGMSRNGNEWHSFAKIYDAGMSAYNGGHDVMINNIFGPPVDGYKSVPYFWKDADDIEGGKARDTLRYNIFWTGHAADTLFIFEHGSTNYYNLSNVTAAEPTVENNNLEGSPYWVDSVSCRGARNVELNAGSIAIDAGGPLTDVVGTVSSSTEVPVKDASYFVFDWGSWAGSAIKADSVLIGTDRCLIDSVDYAGSKLILVDAINASDGDDVHVLATWDYKTEAYVARLYGSAPDIGPYEYIYTGVSAPDTSNNVFPVNGTTQPTSVTIRWNKVDGATQYWLSYTKDNWATETWAFTSSNTDTTETITGLGTSQTIHWNVAAGNASYWSAFTTATMFYTAASGSYTDQTFSWNNTVDTLELTSATKILLSDLKRRDYMLLIQNPSGYDLTFDTAIKWPTTGTPSMAAGQDMLLFFFRKGTTVYGHHMGNYTR